jgi:hypothetical protein
VPVGADVEAMHRLVADDAGAEGAALSAEVAVRVAKRASECGKGIEPSWWDDDAALREKLAPNRGCFDAADAELGLWLGRRRLAQLLAKPPLRRLPDKPAASYGADEPIASIAFADAAGVVALQWPGRVRVFDADDASVVAEFATILPGAVSLSPNGRVVAIAGDNGVQLRETLGGPIVTIANVRPGTLAWLGGRGLAYARATDGAVHVLDVASDRTSRLAGVRTLRAVVALPDSATRFALLDDDRVWLLELGAAGKPFPAKPQEEMMLPAQVDPDIAPVVTADRHLLVGTSDGVFEVVPAFGRITKLEYGGMQVRRVLPTAHSQRRLLEVVSAKGNRTIAYDEQRKLMSIFNRRVDERLDFVPGLERLAAVRGSRLRLIDDIAVQRPIEDFAMIRAFADEDAAVVAATDPAAPALPPAKKGKEALVDALRRGVIRLANDGDFAMWKAAYQGKAMRPVTRSFEDRMRHTTRYMIVGDFTIPEDLTGAASAIFIIAPTAPFPYGEASHSPLLDIKSGACVGWACSALNEQD